MFCIFGFLLLMMVVVLVIGYLYGGLIVLFLLVVLVFFEVLLLFDNVIINVVILQWMSLFWQWMFLIIGIFIVVFGMWLVFLWVIIWIIVGLDFVCVMELVFCLLVYGVLEFVDGLFSYEKLIIVVYLQIVVFGGMFLLMFFLDFVVYDCDIKWLKWIEVFFVCIG